jgi:hypothetical protein
MSWAKKSSKSPWHQQPFDGQGFSRPHRPRDRRTYQFGGVGDFFMTARARVRQLAPRSRVRFRVSVRCLEPFFRAS